MIILWFFALLLNVLLLISTLINKEKVGLFFLPLLGMSLNLVGWVLCELILKMVPIEGLVLLIHEGKYLFILGASEMTLLFIKTYVRKGGRHGKAKILRMAFDALLLVTIWTNSWHHLFRISIWYDGTESNLVYTVNGPIYYLVTFYIYSMVVMVLLLLIQHIFSQAKIYRRQSRYILLGIVLAFATNIFFQYLQVFFSSEDHMDFTSLTFGLIAWVIYYCLFVYRYTDIAEYAKDMILSEMDMGIVFLDTEDRIYYINLYSENLFGITHQEAMYQPLTQVSPRLGQLLEESRNTNSPIRFRMIVDTIHFYEFSRKELSDDKNRKIGSLVGIKDITDIERERAEEHSENVLRHVRKSLRK